MAGHKTMRGSGKSTIRKQRDGVAQTRADNRGGHAEHLPHARAAGRPFIPDNDYIARFDLSGLYRHKCVFFPIIDFCRSPKLHHRVARNLDHAAFRGKITL